MLAKQIYRRLPFAVAPLILYYGFHATQQHLIRNDGLLNPAQVSARLRHLEETTQFDRGSGVLRFDFSQLPSNSPCEDNHSEKVVQVPFVTPQGHEFSADWHFYGIYDGHGGFSTSQKLKEVLIPKVLGELNSIYKPVVEGSTRRLSDVPEDSVDAAIERAFVQLDNEIVNSNIDKLLANPSRELAIELLPPALSGSCALLAFYDTHTRILRTANTGDSRAVLGLCTENGQWQAKSLTQDQTGSNEYEVARIRSEHPQSEQNTCVRRGRVLGIYEPTRSFGDGAVKWSQKIQRKLSSLFFGTNMPSTLLTPPYMTAKPQITRTQLNVNEEPGFVVIGSDGLFEMLSNDQVVGLVVDWLQQRQPQHLSSIYEKGVQGSTVRGADRMGRLGSFFFRRKQRRQIGDPVEDISEHKENLRSPIYKRQQSEEKDESKPKWTSAQDGNAATHLIRNALGGEDLEQVSLLLSIPSPMSRNYRDDLSVTVVFLGNKNGGDGSVRKPKL